MNLSFSSNIIDFLSWLALAVMLSLLPIAGMAQSDSCDIEVTIQYSPDPVCADELVTFSAFPDNGGSNNSYQWTHNGIPVGSNSPTYSDSGFTNGDSVAVIVVSDTNCSPTTSDTSSVILTVIDISASTASTPASCDSADGSIQISGISGGDAPYSFSLNGGAAQSDSSFSNVPAGQHIVTVTDDNGCEKQLTIIVPNSDGISDLSFTVTDQTCGLQDGEISIQGVTGGTAPFEFDLNNGLQTQTSSTFPVDFQGLTSGSYSLLVTDDSSCTYIINGIYIDLKNEITNVPYNVNPESCLEEDGMIIIDENNISGGQAPYSFSIDTGANFQNNNIFSGLTAGTYSLIAMDDNGCTFETSFVIGEPNYIEGNYFPQLVDCDKSSSFLFLDGISGGTPPYSIEVNGQSVEPDSENRLGEYELNETLIIVTSDSNNCESTDTVVVIRDPKCDIKPYNIFSPNGDGIEDTWRIVNIDNYPENEVFVFNRFGQRVFHQSGYTNDEGWDGRYLGKVLPVATYYFIIELQEDQDGNMVREKGAISIIK